MAYHMHSRQNLKKFPEQVQMQLSSKPLIFSQIFIAFFLNIHKISRILQI